MKQCISSETVVRKQVLSSSDAALIVQNRSGESMARQFIITAILLLSGCVTISDGVFRQVDGRPMDYIKFDQLEESRTTLQEVINLLGEPSSRKDEENGIERVEYVSVRRRESTRSTFGIVTERHGQSVIESFVFLFKGGILFKKIRPIVWCPEERAAPSIHQALHGGMRSIHTGRQGFPRSTRACDA